MGLFETMPYVNFQDLNLDGIIRSMKTLLEDMRKLEELVGGYNTRIVKLEHFISNLENGKFPPEMIKSLYKWLEVNVPEILSMAVKQVWFGLTDGGYFVAYIPESWRDITFGTTEYDMMTILMPEFGHLVLMTKEG